MAERYRQLERPTLLETGISQSNAGTAAEALAETFRRFENRATQIITPIRQQQGFEAGQEAGQDPKRGTTGPDGKELLLNRFRSFGAYGQAYNNAATRSYLTRQELDAENTGTVIETEAGNDPEKFVTRFDAARDSVLKTSEPRLRSLTAELWNRRRAEGLGRVEQARAVEMQNQFRKDTAEGISRATDRIARLRAEDDPAKAMEAEVEDQKLQMYIDGAVRSGTLSPTEGEALRKEAARGITKQTVVARFNKELDNPYGDPIGFLTRLREANKTSEALAPEEEAKLTDSLFAELADRNRLAEYQESQLAAAEKSRYDAGDLKATTMLASGKLTRSRLVSMLQNRELEPSVGRTLLNALDELATKPEQKSDPKELAGVEMDLLGQTEEAIKDNPELSWSDKARLVLKRKDEIAGWRGTKRAIEAADRIKRQLGLEPGVMRQSLSEEERDQLDTAMTDWFTAMEAVDPKEREAKVIDVAEEVIDRVFKRNAKADLAKAQRALERMPAATLQRYGVESLDKLSKAQRAEYEKKLAERRQRVKELEAAAK